MTSIKRNYNVKIERLPPEKMKYMTFKELFFKNFKAGPKSIPSSIDLRNKMPQIFDQGNLGSCTANALCGIIGYKIPKFMGSRLFLYYNERKLENNISDDTGATLEDGIKCLFYYGICPESEWPYIISKFAVKPPNTCYSSALKHRAVQVKHIYNDLASMKASLANGNPFVVGIAVYQSFESRYVEKTGIVPMPKKLNEQFLGGHAVMCVGYNDAKKVWIMRNSWGNSWGDRGYFYLPYQYLLDQKLSTDMWSILNIK
jgi:C1A family cysteine protease